MKLNSEKMVSRTAAPGKVVEINGFESRKKEQIEKWLREQIFRLYGEKDEAILTNPLFRICAKFEALSIDAQSEIYGFAKGRIWRIDDDVSRRDKLMSLLASGCNADGALEDIEEFVDTFLIKEKAYK